MSKISRRYIDHMKLAAYVAFWFITFFHVLSVPIFYRCIYGCTFCMLLFNFISYVFLLCMYVLFCMFCFHGANWHYSATLTEVFRAFSSVVMQMPDYTSQRRGTARTLPQLIVLFCVLFVCKCVLYYCHRMSTYLQLTNISINSCAYL